MTARRAAPVLVFVVGTVAGGCSIITDFSRLSDRPDASVTDGAVADTAVTDTSTPDAPLTDAGPNDSATLDVDQGDGGVCSGPALVGSATTNFTTTDTIAVGSADAYGYIVAASGTARCAWVYLEPGDAGGQIQVGVYTDSSGPNVRKAVATLSSPKVGWNSALLDVPYVATAGQTVWLAVLDTGAAIKDRVQNPCANSPLNVVSRAGISLFPDPFGGSPGGQACSASLYLTP